MRLAPNPAAAMALVEFLAKQQPKKRERTVDKPGWYFGADRGAVFVMPNGAIGTVPGEEVRLDMEPPPSIYRSRGELKAWRAGIASMAHGNPLVTFAISVAFASPLLELINEPGGGFNLQGRSRTGKTTALQMAGSAWGAPSGRDAFVRTWDSTSAHFEAALSETNGTLAAYDEAGTADPHRVGNAIYMVTGGAGRGRATANGRTREVASWSVIVLSTGELGFAALLAAAGHQMTAGQAGRLVDVPADVEGGHGVFAELHGHAGGGELAEAMKRCAMDNHGLAGPAFLKFLAPKVAKDPAWAQEKLAPQIGCFLEEFLPSDSDGQVRAVARRFGLVGVAGELATEAGVTGWELRQAWHAAGEAFAAWLAKRGSTEAGEDLAAIDRVRSAIERHSRHRFTNLSEDEPEFATQEDIEKPKPPIDRGPISGLGALGWKRWTPHHRNEGGGRWSYLFHTSGWREVLGSLDPVQSARALERHGLLVPGAKTASRIVKIPGNPNGVRVYEVKGEILAASSGGID
jgi:putative DNA primase/helicase